ncbi:MAG: helix-turn-helix domain-containing protein [Afipia sp.]
MSWQATAWAIKQTAGSPACKLTLLTLANYADDTGCCWPSQETLAADTEQSVDTVQRKLKDLEARGLIRKVARPQGRGRWPGRTYFLNMTVAEMTEPQSAARSGAELCAGDPIAHRAPIRSTEPQDARDHAAPDPTPCRTTPDDHAALLRHEPSIEPSIEPSLEASVPKKPKPTAIERRKAFKESRKGVEVIQNRIAQKLGRDGWVILQSLDPTDLDRVTRLEERRQLNADGLEVMRNHYRIRNL